MGLITFYVHKRKRAESNLVPTDEIPVPRIKSNRFVNRGLSRQQKLGTKTLVTSPLLPPFPPVGSFLLSARITRMDVRGQMLR